MNLPRSFIALASVVGAMGACSSFSGGATDETPSSDEAGAPPLEAGSTDAAVDAIAPDPADAAVDPATTYANAVLADGPVAYWRFHDPFVGLTDSVAVSEFDNADMQAIFPGTLPAFQVDGLFGPKGAFRFNGTPGMLVEAKGVEYLGDGDVTVEAWFKPMAPLAEAGVDSTFRYLFDQANGHGSAYGIYFANGQVVAQRYNSGQNHTAPEDAPPSNAWHFVVFVRSSAGFTLYVDMQSFDGGAPATQTTSANQPFSIGAEQAASPSVEGDITEVAVFNTALTPAQLNQHYLLGKPR